MKPPRGQSDLQRTAERPPLVALRDDSTSRWLADVLGLFPTPGLSLERVRELPLGRLPQPYHDLLAHDRHMTEALETRHGGQLHLEVLDVLHSGDFYARKLVLRAGVAGAELHAAPVVLFGVMRVLLDCCSAAVRQEIVAAREPLGRVLAAHGVLRRVQAVAALEVPLDGDVGRLFATPLAAHGPSPRPLSTYGRLAMIFCDETPAVELFEVVRPEIPNPHVACRADSAPATESINRR